MKVIFFIYLICLSFRAKSQEINWQKTSSWKLYAISGDQGLRVSLDTLQKFSFVDMNEDTVHKFLKIADTLARDNKPVWMGAYYATCIVDGSVHKIDLSMYGGFFYDEKVRRFYILPTSTNNKWLEWLNSVKKRIK